MPIEQDTVVTVRPVWEVLLINLGIIAAAIVIGLVAHWLLFRILTRVTARTKFGLDDVLVRRLRRPARFVLPLVVVLFAVTPMVLGDLGPAVRHGLSLAIIAAFTWTLIAVIEGIEEHALARWDVTVADNLRARKRHTQIAVLTRTVEIFLIIIAIAVALMTFPRVREFGTSLLASAGLAGLVVGLAARPVFENLIAGLQIAMTEPIRLDDVVIVSGEWGRVEEITATYVVVRIWDERRLIVPLSFFLQNPFQNWTRTSAQLLGTVFLYTDYTVPVQALRDELKRICEGSKYWDGRLSIVQVTDATSATTEVRCLVSAGNSGALFDLRCEVREKLIDFLQREYPGALPRTRAQLQREPRGDEHRVGETESVRRVAAINAESQRTIDSDPTA